MRDQNCKLNPQRIQSMTDLAGWRLKVEDGRQTWEYLESEKKRQEHPQTFGDKYWLGVLHACRIQSINFQDETKLPKPETAHQAAENGFIFYKNLQSSDGHWPGEYGGPMFLIPGLVITMYITESEWNCGQKQELIRYLCNRAHPVDGGWGMHVIYLMLIVDTSKVYPPCLALP